MNVSIWSSIMKYNVFCYVIDEMLKYEDSSWNTIRMFHHERLYYHAKPACVLKTIPALPHNYRMLLIQTILRLKVWIRFWWLVTYYSFVCRNQWIWWFNHNTILCIWQIVARIKRFYSQAYLKMDFNTLLYRQKIIFVV